MVSEQRDKSSRVLELYQTLLTGKTINKSDAAQVYGVNPRSIQRDIDAIRNFLAEQNAKSGCIQTIEYDKTVNGYKLVTQDVNYLSNGEMLAVCKILLSSRSLSKAEIASLLNRLLQLCVSQKDKTAIEGYFANEIYNYIDPAHASPNVDLIWQTAEAIKTSHFVEITYTRLKKPGYITRVIEPVGILFSEYYFYLLGIIVDQEKRKNFDKADDPFPTIYRLDRIQNIKTLNETFSIPYAERFQEGKYKNAIQFMYGGEPQRVVFEFSGLSIEPVLDRLPMAEVQQEKDGPYTVSVDTFGKGILIWLLSQGSRVNVLSPDVLRNEWLRESKQILEKQEKGCGN